MMDMIKLYKSHTALWDRKHIQNKSITIKNEYFGQILKIINEKHGTDFNLEFLKKEIKKLRTKFFKEEYLLRTKQKPTVSWSYFNQMSFLLKEEESNKVTFEVNSLIFFIISYYYKPEFTKFSGTHKRIYDKRGIKSKLIKF